MENYARQVDGRSFSYPVELAMPYDYYEGAIKGIQTADNSFFCSKLASQTFKEAGIIALDTPTNAILPGHFALPSGLAENPIQFYNNRLDSIINFKPE